MLVRLAARGTIAGKVIEGAQRCLGGLLRGDVGLFESYAGAVVGDKNAGHQ